MIIGTISFIISVLLFGLSLMLTLGSEPMPPILTVTAPTAIVAIWLCRFSIRKLENASAETTQAVDSYGFGKKAILYILMIALIYFSAFVISVFLVILGQVNVHDENWYTEAILLVSIFACVLVPLFYLVRKMRNMRKVIKARNKTGRVNYRMVNPSVEPELSCSSVDENCIQQPTTTDPTTLAPYEYEKYVAKYLLKHGYKSATVTQQSGDYGVDIIAVNAEGWRIAIQCKRYRGSVGVSAIQEIVTGKEFQGCDLAAVYTTGSYTQQAISLARKVHVKLYTLNKDGLRTVS